MPSKAKRGGVRVRRTEYPEGACSPWPAPLDPRHKIFLNAYLLTFNGRQSAIEAGFPKPSAHNMAYKLLNRPDIRVHIDLDRLRRTERMTGGVSRERYMQELERVALVNFGDMAPMFGDGGMVEKLGNLTRDQSACISSVVLEEFTDGRSDRREVRRTKFTLVSKEKGLELLGRANGWMQDKVSHDHKHQHQHLVLGAMLKDIAAAESGRPIVDAVAVPALSVPIVEPEEAA